MIRQEKLSLNEATNILHRAEKGEYENDINIRVPVRPRGGDVILYRKKKASDIDYRCDQYVWRNGGNNRYHTATIETYYRIVSTSAPASHKGFAKSVFQLKKPANILNPIVLIHYTGDETIFTSRPHGNAKTQRPYVRTSKSCIDKIRDDVKRPESAPKHIYQEALRKSRKDRAGEDYGANYNQYEPVVGPRNIMQVKNLRKSEHSKEMLLRDELFSIFEMTKGDLKDFLKKYTYTPDGSILVLGSQETIDFSQKLLKECNTNSETLAQLITYDTTFECGDIYVSPLVMRNTYLTDDPIFPVLFLLHDRKKQWQHEEFFQIAVKELKLNQNATMIPLATDREKSIVNAISNVYPGSNHVFCQNHIQRDVEFWIKQQKNYTSDDIKALKHNIRQLLESESAEEFDLLYEQISKKWTASFLEYFNKNLLVDVRTRGAAFNFKKFLVFKDVSATNNQSESFNKVIKEAICNKELPLDALFLALFQIQMYYLNEFNRALRNLGQCTPKDEYKTLKQIPLGPLAHLTSREIIERLAASVQNVPHATEKTAKYRSTTKALAKLIIDNDLLSIDSKSKSHIVRSPYQNERYIIWIENDRYVCSCKSTGLCSHVIAVLMFNEIDIPEGNQDKCTYKLSVLLKRKRGHEGKSGRKKPRAKDIDVTIIEADDSIAAKQKCHGFPSTSTPKKKKKRTTDINSTKYHDDKKANESNSSKQSEKDTIIKELFHCPNKFKVPETNQVQQRVQSLLPRTDIMGFVIDDVLISIVNEKDIGYCVLYLDTMTQRDITCFKYKDVLNQLGQYQALNKDYLLITMNTDTRGQGSHWLLGMVAFNVKTIIIFDSLHTSEEARIPQFKQLAVIAFLSTYLANQDFDIDLWDFILSNDSPKQPNGYDCGLFSTVIAVCILFGKEYVSLSSQVGRKWMQFIIANADQPVLRLEPRISFVASDEMEQRCISDLNKWVNKDLNLTTMNTEDLTIDIATTTDEQGWTVCGANDSCGRDISHAEAHVMCVQCRTWFHEMCAGSRSKDCVYFVCLRCCGLKKS